MPRTHYIKEGDTLYDHNGMPLGTLGNYSLDKIPSKENIRKIKVNGNDQFPMPRRIHDSNRAYRTIRDILARCRENGIVNTMPGIIERGSYADVPGGHGDGFNMYPSATNGDWHPDFLGICYGSEKLSKVFMKAEEHQRPVNDPNDIRYQLESTITIITDKWDRETFLKHESSIVNCAAHNCTITVILITDYGWTEVFNLCASDVLNSVSGPELPDYLG